MTDEKRKINPEIVAYAGEMSDGIWTYDSEKHRLSGFGTFWDPKIDLYKNLLELKEYDADKAKEYLQEGKKAFARRAHLMGPVMGGLGAGLLGGVIGLVYAYKKGDKEAEQYVDNDFVCLQARFKNGKRLIGVAYRELYDTILATHREWLDAQSGLNRP